MGSNPSIEQLLELLTDCFMKLMKLIGRCGIELPAAEPANILILKAAVVRAIYHLDNPAVPDEVRLCLGTAIAKWLLATEAVARQARGPEHWRALATEGLISEADALADLAKEHLDQRDGAN